MAAATVEIDESNGAGETVTHGITNSNMGSTDAVNLAAATYPITAGASSYAKYQRFHMTDKGTSDHIQNLKVWRTGDALGSDTHITNAGIGAAYTQKTYATPAATAIADVDNTMPTAVPASANLGIGGNLAGTLSAAGSSDYLVHQIVVDAGTVAGKSCTMNYQYDEVA